MAWHQGVLCWLNSWGRVVAIIVRGSQSPSDTASAAFCANAAALSPPLSADGPPPTPSHPPSISPTLPTPSPPRSPPSPAPLVPPALLPPPVSPPAHTDARARRMYDGNYTFEGQCYQTKFITLGFCNVGYYDGWRRETAFLGTCAEGVRGESRLHILLYL